MPYIGKSPSAGVRQRYQYTATAGQTTFSGTDLGNLTLTYTDNNFVDVFQNGVLLKGGGTDYTATSGTSVVLATGASVSDVIEIIVYDVFSVGNFFNRTDSDSRYVNVDGDTMTGTLALNVSGSSHLTTTTSGTSNLVLGVNAGNSITSGGNYNTCIGDEAGTAITTGVENTLVGYQAGDAITDADYNVGLGWGALGANVLGSKSVAVGTGALDTQNPASATDMHNTAVGHGAGTAITTGKYNTFVGSEAGDGVDDADYNVAVGYKALSANCGQLNVAVGADALEACTGANNTAVGYRAGEAITSGSQNCFMGTYTADGGDDSNYNTAIGYATMSNANFGDGNTALGWVAGFGIQGDNNTVLGNEAGYELTTGGNNLFIGKDAGRTGSPGGVHNTASNRMVLGDENITNCHIQVDWTIASDQRDKTDFTALDVGLDFVKQLNPVTYRWDKRSKYGDKNAEDYDLNKQNPDGTHKEDWLDIGFKAQEVEALEKAAGYKIADKTNLTTTLSDDGKQYGIQYTKFVPILVKAVQELSAKNDALEARIKKLEDG